MSNTFLLPLTRGFHAIVDEADRGLVGQRSWHAHKSDGRWYARNSEGERLHRVLLGLAKGDVRVGDHIDRDTMNNCRANLRIVSTAVNNQNCGPHSDSSSGVRGVHWCARLRKWVGQIVVDGRRVYCGAHDSIELAALEVAFKRGGTCAR